MIAFIFPGQGSQSVGMARSLYETSPTAKAVLDDIEGTLLGLLTLMFEGPDKDLTQTQNAQPALLAHSVAVNAVLQEQGIGPAVVAGHSLGEYSALVAAGCLDAVAAARLVRIRGQLMAEVGQQVGGTMAAVIGLNREALEQAVAQAQEVGIVCVANLNAPGQIVISGEEPAVRRASELASEAGARRVMPLNVSGAFHSPLMQPAADRFAEVLAQVDLQDATVPLVSNVDAAERTSAASIRQALLAQLTGSVRWDDSINRMIAMGVTAFIEVGPGKVLANMLKRSAPDVAAYNADGPEAIADVVAALQS
ncbi:MAG: ACP S-malonyltransferase [Armatimonadia bacterium]